MTRLRKWKTVMKLSGFTTYDIGSMATAFEKGKNNDDDEFVLFLYIPLIFSFVSHSE